ncbi:MAG: hypothetical protein V5B78_03355 [Desulfohalobiaceae bacterium]
MSEDEEGGLGEGAEESFEIITPQDEFVAHSLGRFSTGITVSRVVELARALVPDRGLGAVEERRLLKGDLTAAREGIVFGTILDVLPVMEVNGHRIGDGRPGPWSRCFLELLQGIWSQAVKL